MPFGLFEPDVLKLEKKQDVNGIIKALSHKKVEINYLAMEVLVGMKSKEVIAALANALKVPDIKVARCRVARTLGKTHNPLAVAPLIEALKDPDDRLRGIAARALSEIGDKTAVNAISCLTNDKNEDVRLEVAMALCKLGDRRGPKLLAENIKDNCWHTKYVLETLYESSNPKVLKVLYLAGKKFLKNGLGGLEFFPYAAATDCPLNEQVRIGFERQLAEFLSIRPKLREMGREHEIPSAEETEISF